MISINICGLKKDIEEVTESWIAEQILNRRNVGITVWIKVNIDNYPIRIVLTTRDCPPSKEVAKSIEKGASISA